MVFFINTEFNCRYFIGGKIHIIVKLSTIQTPDAFGFSCCTVLCFLVLLGPQNSVLNFVKYQPKDSSHIKKTFLYKNCLSNLSRQVTQMLEAMNKRWLRCVGSRAIEKSHAENSGSHMLWEICSNLWCI